MSRYLETARSALEATRSSASPTTTQAAPPAGSAPAESPEYSDEEIDLILTHFPSEPAEILAFLRRCGIQLVENPAGRLLPVLHTVAPPELADLLERHKSGLLAAVRTERAQSPGTAAAVPADRFSLDAPHDQRATQ